MNAAVLAVAYWYLVSVTGSYNDGTLPRAIGPFPSRELCRQAGASQFPLDERFFDASRLAQLIKDRAIQAAAYKARQAEDDAIIQAAWQKAGRKAGWVTIRGDRVDFNTEGQRRYFSQVLSDTSVSGWRVCPCYMPITGCQSDRP